MSEMKGSKAKDVSSMSKSDRKAYHKEIQEFYLQNGWRDTLSSFALSPTQGSEIITDKMRGERKGIEKEAKKAEREERKLNRKKAKKNPEATEAAPKKRGRKPKAQAEADKEPAKAKGTKRSKSLNVGNAEEALDFLLQYRQKAGAVSLDEAIVNLALLARAA